jgi:HCOMODA/2-hydroxy-3-carboxy-muconic semialdehyde decarboxylase
MIADVNLAARALARHELVHAYGHVSARIDDKSFSVTLAHPLGTTMLETEQITVPITGELNGALPEVRIHQAIYRARAEVGGICRFQSHHVIALSTLRRTPRALHGLGAYFAPQPPLWDDPMLVRDDARATALATELGMARAIVMRGNGAVTVGANVREAACHAFFLEDAARIELAVLGADPIPYTADQASQRASAGLYDRMWELLNQEIR